MISTCVIHQTKLNVLNTYVEYENFVNLEAPGVSHILVLQNCEFMASNERPSAVRLRFWSIVIPTQPCSPLNCFGVFGLLQFCYYIHKPAYQWEEGRSHHHLLSVCVCVCVCLYACLSVRVRFIASFSVNATIIDFFSLYQYFLEKQWLDYFSVVDLELSLLQRLGISERSKIL